MIMPKRLKIGGKEECMFFEGSVIAGLRNREQIR